MVLGESKAEPYVNPTLAWRHRSPPTPASLAGGRLPPDIFLSSSSIEDYPGRQYVSLADDDDDGGDENDEADTVEPPESRERRLLELGLLHNYILSQSTSLNAPLYPIEAQDPETSKTQFHWGIEIVQMAFEDDTILYAILAHSALSKWTQVAASKGEGDGGDEHEGGDEGDHERRRVRERERERERDEWRRLQQRYLTMALREHRRAVSQLSGDNADRVCIGSLMLLNHSFALVQTIPAQPVWQPPVEWLEMGHGTAQVLMVARGGWA